MLGLVVSCGWAHCWWVELISGASLLGDLSCWCSALLLCVSQCTQQARQRVLGAVWALLAHPQGALGEAPLGPFPSSIFSFVSPHCPHNVQKCSPVWKTCSLAGPGRGVPWLLQQVTRSGVVV